MQELTPAQIQTLRLVGEGGFSFVSFPLMEQGIGVRRGNCAGLVIPASDGSLKLLGEPGYLVDGRIGVVVFREGRKFFVCKKAALEATPERERELDEFNRDLRARLTDTERGDAH